MGLATLDNRWLQVNEALCETLGYLEAELLSKPLSHLIVPEEMETIQRYLRQLLAGEVLGYHVETRAQRADGQIIWVQLSVSLVHDYEGAPAYVFAEIQDISERKRLEQELEQGTLLDAVTGLPSRTLLFDRLEQARARLERSGSPFVVMFAEAAGPEAVSARFGRERADAVLTELGARMVAAVRSGDTVARYSADEFVILCEDLENEEEASAIAARILDLGQFTVGDGESAVELSVTLGLTVAANDDDSPAGLVERADAAMNVAKGEGVGFQEYCDSF
jgi:PAS domain S-box-containing protein/diguanylate cyclase (GGDEF)-like protein